jgi:hypothetical protein
MDEETFGSNDALRMMFELAREQKQTVAKRMANFNIGIKRLLSKKIQSSVIHRISTWMKTGRFGCSRED